MLKAVNVKYSIFPRKSKLIFSVQEKRKKDVSYNSAFPPLLRGTIWGYNVLVMRFILHWDHRRRIFKFRTRHFLMTFGCFPVRKKKKRGCSIIGYKTLRYFFRFYELKKKIHCTDNREYTIVGFFNRLYIIFSFSSL